MSSGRENKKAVPLSMDRSVRMIMVVLNDWASHYEGLIEEIAALKNQLDKAQPQANTDNKDGGL